MELTRTLSQAARANHAAVDVGSVFVLADGHAAAKTLAARGYTYEPREIIANREHRLQKSAGQILIVVEAHNDDDLLMERSGFARVKKNWRMLTDAPADDPDCQVEELDRKIRALKSPDGHRAGWTVMDDDGSWVFGAKGDSLSALRGFGYDKAESDLLIGLAAKNNWRVVNLPFQDEYPGDRQWNIDAAQYRYQPATMMNGEIPFHPHWDKVLRHCGQDLDEALKSLPWARAANIKTGADYLLKWAACMLRAPLLRLPYLFFYGDQNSGKSIYHEALSLLMTTGVVAADRALTNASDFNGELANGVLATIEEKDISLTPGAYNKIKDWTTSERIWIRRMRTDAYPQVNTLHFVQCANERSHCTIKPGDTRITMMYVPPLAPGEEIPKLTLLEKLAGEAPHFMRTIMDLTLPTPIGRLGLEYVDTAGKSEAIASTLSDYASALLEHLRTAQFPAVIYPGQFDELFGVGKWPRDRRAAQKALSTHEGYFHRLGYTIDWDQPRRNAGRPIIISRT